MTPENKQLLRTKVNAFLAERPSFSFTVSDILERLHPSLPDLPINEQAIAEALAFLQGFDFVKAHTNPLGAGIRYQATPQGILFHERNP